MRLDDLVAGAAESRINKLPRVGHQDFAKKGLLAFEHAPSIVFQNLYGGTGTQSLFVKHPRDLLSTSQQQLWRSSGSATKGGCSPPHLQNSRLSFLKRFRGTLLMEPRSATESLPRDT